MDFKKIEWIFFLAFLGVNIFLFNIYHATKNEEGNVSSTNQKIDILQRLEADEISIKGKLSSEIKEGYYLAAVPTNMNEAVNTAKEKNGAAFNSGTNFVGENHSQFIYTPSTNFYIKDSKETKENVDSFLKDSNEVLFGQEYMYVPHESLTDPEYPEIICAQSFEGIPFYDDTSKMEIILEENDGLLRVSRYMQTHLSAIEKLREKMGLYSEKDAVNTLYINNKLPAKSKILWRRLSYVMILQVRGKNVYVPAWLVAVETGKNNVQIETVNAFTNRIITNNTLQKVENTN